jgi:tight adherence protein C
MSANTYAFVIAAAIFLGISAIAVLLLVMADARSSRQVRRRLGLSSADNIGLDGAPEGYGLLQGAARGGQKIEQFVDKEGETAKLLFQAGWRGAQSRLFFYAFQGVLPILAMALFAVSIVSFDGKMFKPPFVFLIGFAVFAISILIPRYVLRSVAKGRRERIKREVPLFAHVLVLLFEAGLSTRQALATLVREGEGVLPELGVEFDAVVRQFDGGADTGDVLRALAESLEVEDLSNILSVLRQVDRYGGEIREPLLDMLKLLEERHGLEMRERVNIMSGKMTVVMVLFFFPALIIFAVGPAVVSIITVMGPSAGK